MTVWPYPKIAPVANPNTILTPKCLVTLSTYRRYINKCIYLSIYLSIYLPTLTLTWVLIPDNADSIRCWIH